METDDLAQQPEPTLLGFIKTKLPECLGGSCSLPEQPGLLSQQIISNDRIANLAQEGFTLQPTESLHLGTIESGTVEYQQQQLEIPNYQDTTYNPTIFTELEFYKSNDPSGQTPSVFDIISKPALSITGREYLRKITSRPTTNLELLFCRQHTIQFLTNSQHTKEIKKILQQFKLDEPALYWLLDKKTPEMREVLDIIFFTKSWNKCLNKNTGFITAYFYFIMVFNPLWGVCGPVILLLIPFLVSKYIMHIPIPFSTYLQTLKSTLFGDKFFAMLIMGRQIFNTLSGGMGSTGNENLTHNPSTRIRNTLINKAFDIITSEFGRWLYLSVVIGGYLWTIYNQIVVSYNFNKLINFIHERLNKFRQVLEASKIIIQICDRADQSGLRCPEFNRLVADCIQLINTHPVIQLIANDPVFISVPGFFSNKGAIIKTFYMLEMETSPPISQQIIMPFIRLLGYIDGWHAVSTLGNHIPGLPIATAKYDTVSYSPCLYLDGEYSPVCSGCVANSVSMGITDTNSTLNNILLTGPNGSGKSTFLKSVMTNIILAQTLGIAFARDIRLTPFQYLSTYLNIPDCQGRESLFQAEMTRCHQHITKLRDLEQYPERQGFSFNIMDEIFVSTNYLEGMSGAYAVIKHLGTLKNSCHIITTHFDKLVSLDSQSNCQSDNNSNIPGYTNKYFKIDVLGDPADEQKEIHKDYILRDGVNDRHLALHLLKLRGFDSEIIRDAQTMYSRLTSSTDLSVNNFIHTIQSQIPEPQTELPTTTTPTIFIPGNDTSQITEEPNTTPLEATSMDTQNINPDSITISIIELTSTIKEPAKIPENTPAN